MLDTAMHYSHTLLKECLAPGDIAIDATMGNGHDTLFLSQCVTAFGHVYAFDIQEQALTTTQQRLKKADLHNTTCFLRSHADMADVLPEHIAIKGAIFNLGYLPQSDKQITTKPDSTIQALSYLLAHIAPAGRIVLVLYYGHPGGNEEKEAVLHFASNLPQEDYTVMSYQFLNQKNYPPICLCIEKKARP